MKEISAEHRVISVFLSPWLGLIGVDKEDAIEVDELGVKIL